MFSNHNQCDIFKLGQGFTLFPCACVWCHSAHTHLIDGVLNNVLCIVTGCLRPTPTDPLPTLSDIQHAELCRLGVTFSLAKCSNLDLDHILHCQLAGSPDMPQERLKSKSPFVPAAQKLLSNRIRHSCGSVDKLLVEHRVLQKHIHTLFSFLGLVLNSLE